MCTGWIVVLVKASPQADGDVSVGKTSPVNVAPKVTIAVVAFLVVALEVVIATVVKQKSEKALWLLLLWQRLAPQTAEDSVVAA